MNKFYVRIGFSIGNVETAPGVWGEKIEERRYYAEVTRNTRKWESAQTLNDNINISNIMSIISDPYTTDHLHLIRYVEFRGALWEVSTIEERYPRLILTLGGVYNGEQA